VHVFFSSPFFGFAFTHLQLAAAVRQLQGLLHEIKHRQFQDFLEEMLGLAWLRSVSPQKP
jgi:hypothetical protein